MPRRVVYILLLAVQIVFSAPARGQICEVLARLVTIHFHEAEERSEKNSKFLFTYKNHPTLPPKEIDLAEATLADADQELEEELQWIYPARNPTKASKYERAVLLLQKGDTVKFGKVQFKLGNFLGAGNATHIYALAERPGEAIRIPLLNPQLIYRQTGQNFNQADRMNLHLKQSRAWMTARKGENPIPVNKKDSDKKGSFQIVKEVIGSTSGTDILKMFIRKESFTVGEILFFPDDFNFDKGSPQDLAKLAKLIELMKKNGHGTDLSPDFAVRTAYARQYVYDDQDSEWYVVDFE